MPDTSDLLRQALQDVRDAADDLRGASLSNADNALAIMLHSLSEEPLSSFLRNALPPVDFDEWWKKVQSTGGSVTGSKALNWPLDAEARVAMQLSLCDRLARQEINLAPFVIEFCRPSGTSNLPEMIASFVDTIVIRMLRDIEKMTQKRVLSPFVFDVLKTLPASGDQTLDSMIEEAAQKFRNPAPNLRREAVERLWDAWERAKTLDDASNKKSSTESLLQRAADDPDFLSLLDAESRELTRIGNSFHIRHHETNKTPISKVEHWDYLFHRMFALLHLLLSRRMETEGQTGP